MLEVRHPAPDRLRHCVRRDLSRAVRRLEAPQPASCPAEVLGPHPDAVREDAEPKEVVPPARLGQVTLDRMDAETESIEKPLDAMARVRQRRPVVAEQGEIVDITNVSLHTKPILHEVIQAIQIHVCEEVAREVADGQAPPPLVGREEVVATEVSQGRRLLVAGIG